MSVEQFMPKWKLIERGADGRKVMLDVSHAQPKYIYHMLRWEHAKSIFETGKLRLSSVRSWQDPYEKWWCDKLFGRPSPLAGFQAYGSCWTSGAYDEPRWRMAGFGRDSTIVRIRCEPDRLLAMAASFITTNAGSLFFGRVRYRGEKRLIELAGSVSAGSRKEVTRMAAAMLLHKRRAFKFEDEMRLLWLDKQPATAAVTIAVDPYRLIDQVMISPHALPADRDLIKAQMKAVGVTCKASGILHAPRERREAVHP